MRRICAVIGVVGLAACGAEQAPDVGKHVAQIQGGSADVAFDGVCGIRILRPSDPEPANPTNRDIECSCTLVGDGIVMTAASCVEPNISDEVVMCRTDPDPPCYDDIDVRFGLGHSGGAANTIQDIKLFRYYDPAVAAINDVALIRFTAQPAENPPIVQLGERDLQASDVGQDITFVGYGETQSMEGDFGTRRFATVPMDAFTASTVRGGDDGTGPCRGDNGGPVLQDQGSGPVQIGLIAGVGLSCQVRSQQRIAPFVSFVHTYVDAFDSNCPLDGACDMGVTCDRSPDPDCDPCLEDGTCADNCETRDFDCPLGAFPGDACTVNSDCEFGGECIAADDDTSFTYCTRECNADESNTGCGPGQECVAGQCKFGIPSPGSQGFECAENENCRSGICEERICVEECTDSTECLPPPEGQDPYTCTPSNVKSGVSVCLGVVQSGGGGFCDPNSVAGRAGSAGRLGGVVVLVLGVFTLVLARRRRR